MPLFTDSTFNYRLAFVGRYQMYAYLPVPITYFFSMAFVAVVNGLMSTNGKTPSAAWRTLTNWRLGGWIYSYLVKETFGVLRPLHRRSNSAKCFTLHTEAEYRHELEAFVFLRYRTGKSQRGSLVDPWLTTTCANAGSSYMRPKIEKQLNVNPF